MDAIIDLTENRDFRFSTEYVADPYLYEASIVDLVGTPHTEFYYPPESYLIEDSETEDSSMIDERELRKYKSILDHDIIRGARYRKGKNDLFWKHSRNRFMRFLVSSIGDGQKETNITEENRLDESANVFASFFAFVSYCNDTTDKEMYEGKKRSNDYFITMIDSSGYKSWNMNNHMDDTNIWFTNDLSDELQMIKFSYDTRIERITVNTITSSIRSDSSTTWSFYNNAYRVPEVDISSKHDFCVFVSGEREHMIINNEVPTSRFILFTNSKKQKRLQQFVHIDDLGIEVEDDALDELSLMSEYHFRNGQILNTITSTNNAELESDSRRITFEPR